MLFLHKNAQIGPPKNSAEKMFGDPFQHTKHLLYIATSLGKDHPHRGGSESENCSKMRKILCISETLIQPSGYSI